MSIETITVIELIELLKQFPQDAKVWTEGCDCYGNVVNVSYDEKSNEILLERDN